MEEDSSNLHPSPLEVEKKLHEVEHKTKEKMEGKEETGPSRTTEANPNARFQMINTKKDEGNFLFREKKYAMALERYVEALLELKVYRRCWRESRMLKNMAVAATTAAQASEARAQTNSLLGKRGLHKDKGKEKMETEDQGAVATAVPSAAAEASSKKKNCRGSAMMVLEEPEEEQERQAMQEDSTLPIVFETSTCTTPSSSSTTEDTMVDWDGLRRKRRRLYEDQCKDSNAADDDMTVEIIDKSDFAMPKDMKCGTSSSSSAALGAISSTPLSSSSSSSSAASAIESGKRSFKNLTECEKNLKRLEIIIRLNIAACGLRLGRGTQALEQCRKVIRINDLECCEPLLYAKALFRKAQSLKILGANKEACATLRIALSFSPTDRAIRNELAALEQTVKKGSIVCKFFEKLRCLKRDNAEEQPQQPPSPPQEVSKGNKCKYFGSLFGGSCSAKTALSFLCRREISHRGLTRQQKVDIACRQLPKDPPATVDKYCRRAYGGQWSGDGELLLTTCQDWKIRIYTNDSKTLSRKCVINAQKGQWTITDALMSSNKSFILYSSITPHVHMVSLPEDLNDFKSKGDHSVLNFIGAQGSDYSGIWCMALSADDREVLAGTSDSSLCVYDLERNQLVECAAAHGDDVNSVCYVDAENGVGSSTPLLASASDDGLIYMWDKRCMNDPVGVLFGHTEGLTCLTSKGDGRYLLSNSKDQTMKLWDLRKMVDRQHAQPPVKKYVWDYRGMSYPGQPGVDKHPHDLSVSTFQGHSVLRTLIRCRFTPSAWSDQRYACTASADGKVYIYDVSSTQLVRVYSATEDKDASAGSSSAIVRDISWHPYLPYLVTTAWNGTVSLFSHEVKATSADDDGEEQP